MTTKSFVWLGMAIGSIVGGALPLLWGGDTFSLGGIAGSVVGGAAGIFVGFRLGQSLGV